ncbi:MAG: iron-sulfur cluster insertion protein ErpA [Rhodospirillaceae bacterium]|jgi:iron-sulfur cluster assembly accessory protein|nr:iron-sulfur cluster insertion protein ErpA [Rhodospirillaceae bacterium]MBT3490808.1 iron-sulfur cluster insertion protein ErpA [Rhodospirillaceae bacterium]MBT3780049.1 iron-sulfur cluster insertion protein ErpA [Rhodospirillaceae bacterium]MBT3976412.1 iron-sulfur cluster insertion protein ErpA [Rhodospirillaceae bacterium]MBT4168300.1 iron-sulfur cluster insertion protein ErpA [Rhodospirillaceae bacterium]
MTDITQNDAAAGGVTVTGDAAKRIAFLMQQEGADAKLRIEVQGGGCSGFSYGFRFDSEVHADDLIIEQDDAVVLIDETSLQFLGGAKIDYVEDLMAAAFRIDNPNASSACGCGTSFAI